MRRGQGPAQPVGDEASAGAKARDLATTAARAIDAKKAEHVEVLDLRGLSILADFFVLGSGFARVQIQALADAATEEMRKAGRRCRSTEGYEDSGWILLDFGDLVMHLMTEEARDYYRLERLWGDAPRVDWKPSPQPSPGKGEGD